MTEVPLCGPSAPTQSSRQSTLWILSSHMGHYEGTSLIRNITPPWGRHRDLSLFLL
jgi:hypothetical protein